MVLTVLKNQAIKANVGQLNVFLNFAHMSSAILIITHQRILK